MGDDPETTVLNIRVPTALKEALDATYTDQGYQNRSEFVRSVLRDAIEESPPPDQTARESSPPTEARPTDTERENADSPGEKPINRLLEASTAAPHPKSTVAVVGCGNVGGLVVDRVTRIRTTNMKTVLVDTDKQDLHQHQADAKVLAGTSISHGLGTGGDPDIGRKAAETSKDDIAEELEMCDVVFVVAGMGGGAGTGASPVVAQAARDCGATVICLLTQPYQSEPESVQIAQSGIETLQEVADGTLVCDLTVVADGILHTGPGKALTALTQLYANVLTQLSVAIDGESDSGLSLSTLESTFTGGTTGTILFTETDIAADPSVIASNAIANSCLPDDVSQATDALLCIDAASIRSEKADAIRTAFSEHFPNTTIHRIHTRRHSLDDHATIYMLLSGVTETQNGKEQPTTWGSRSEELTIYDAIVSSAGVEIGEQKARTIAQQLQQKLQHMELDWDDRHQARTEIELEIKSVLDDNDVTLADDDELVTLLVSQATQAANS